MESTRYRIQLNDAAQAVGFRLFVVTRQDVGLAPLTGTSGVAVASDTGGYAGTGMLNDLAMCADCLREIRDPANRRYGYPFTECTVCGPRFSITQRAPYERALTSMRRFEMCDACCAEYDTPSNRRHHDQSIACPACGPTLSLSIEDIVGALRHGSIVALKGIGGFHLLCDARDAAAVARLRSRKACATPFPVMMPSVAIAREYCLTNQDEEAALASPAAPIVLLRPRPLSDLAPNVADAGRLLGVLLPYSPLHYLVMRAYGAPLVVTGGNVSGEPIATDNVEARRRLGAIADVIVTHNRTIARPCHDSVVRVGAEGPSILRRARGYAPLPIEVAPDLPRALAVGGHRKSTVAIGVGRQAVVSQHLGDLDTAAARCGFEAAIHDLFRTYAFEPDLVVVDRDRSYASRRWAEASGLRLVAVQHHHAHVAGCAAENGVAPPYLGVAWDDGGLGDDGSVWGGEFFAAHTSGFERVAHLRPFRRGVHAPWCTSVGRLFDAVAALTGICPRSRFDGESALALEAAIDPREQGHYPFGDGLSGDWEPLLDVIAADLGRDVPVGAIAARFHLTLVDWIARVAGRVQARAVVLSGSVFQNTFLLDRTAAALRANGHAVHTPRRIPANDGGLSFGQLMLASQSR